MNGNSISELKNARSPIVKAGMGGIATLFLLAGLAQWEGNSFPVYLDMVGVPTVCSGITNATAPGWVVMGQTKTKAECDAMQMKILNEQVIPEITKCRKVDVTQLQHDMLVDFAWNVGTPKLCKSTLMRKLNTGDCWGAGAEFTKWVYAGGTKVNGLVRRRQWNADAFLSECFKPSSPAVK